MKWAVKFPKNSAYPWLKYVNDTVTHDAGWTCFIDEALKFDTFDRALETAMELSRSREYHCPVPVVEDLAGGYPIYEVLHEQNPNDFPAEIRVQLPNGHYVFPKLVEKLAGRIPQWKVAIE